MEHFLSLLSAIIKPRYEEDFVDRLNCRITASILMIFALATGVTQWLGTPIKCWTPKQFPDFWDTYTDDYCFVENTYFLPPDHRLNSAGDHNRQMLNYYQWVQLTLALQAVLFQLPQLIWRGLHWMSGINIRGIIGMTLQDWSSLKSGGDGGEESKTTKETSEKSKTKETWDVITRKEIEMIACHIQTAITSRFRSTTGHPFAWLLRLPHLPQSYYMTSLYLFVKLLYLLNIVFQMCILSAFLGTNYRFWGAEVLFDLLRGQSWTETGHFPRVTLCDLRVRVLGNVQQWTVECVLNINMLNEKMYIFLWWWLAMLFVVTSINLVYWAASTLLPPLRRHFVLHLLNAQGLALKREAGESERVTRFVEEHLGADGVLVARLLATNSSGLLASFVVARLYGKYRVADVQNGHYSHHRRRLSSSKCLDGNV